MITIYPGETDSHEFVLPFAATMVRKAVVSYKQENIVTLEVQVTNFTPINSGSCKFSYTLTQKQALKLRNCTECKIQINVYSIYNDRIVSKPIKVIIGEQFHRQPITN